jgi:transcriptional regulator with XRE-family HTH domain
MPIGEKIKARRKELQWSQRTLSDKIGYANHSTIARIERGEIDLPQSKIAKFAEVLGVDIAYLMNWEEEQKKNDIQVDIVIRMRKDSEFLSVVEKLNNLDPKHLPAVKQFLSVLS